MTCPVGQVHLGSCRRYSFSHKTAGARPRTRSRPLKYSCTVELGESNVACGHIRADEMEHKHLSSEAWQSEPHDNHALDLEGNPMQDSTLNGKSTAAVNKARTTEAVSLRLAPEAAPQPLRPPTLSAIRSVACLQVGFIILHQALPEL